MHDSEQEHSSITGCRVTYESTIFYNEANKCADSVFCRLG